MDEIEYLDKNFIKNGNMFFDRFENRQSSIGRILKEIKNVFSLSDSQVKDVFRFWIKKFDFGNINEFVTFGNEGPMCQVYSISNTSVREEASTNYGLGRMVNNTNTLLLTIGVLESEKARLEEYIYYSWSGRAGAAKIEYVNFNNSNVYIYDGSLIKSY